MVAGGRRLAVGNLADYLAQHELASFFVVIELEVDASIFVHVQQQRIANAFATHRLLGGDFHPLAGV